MPRHSLAVSARMRFEARNILKAIANDNKVPVRDIVGRYGDANLVALRVEFIKRARALGMGSVVIGRIINRGHWTVLYHLNGWRAAKYAAAKARGGR
jgi:chromosomal replication initiation ATPase DnaA